MGRDLLGRGGRRWKNNIEVDRVDDRAQRLAFMNVIINLRIP
jgi:hypothetical protein